jgi:hypothetical protein
MSVGHIARGLEEAGIPTVIIAVKSFRTRMEMMSLPRVLLTNNLLGRVLGNPFDEDSQKNILRQALSLLREATKNSTIAEQPSPPR